MVRSKYAFTETSPNTPYKFYQKNVKMSTKSNVLIALNVKRTNGSARVPQTVPTMQMHGEPLWLTRAVSSLCCVRQCLSDTVFAEDCFQRLSCFCDDLFLLGVAVQKDVPQIRVFDLIGDGQIIDEQVSNGYF